VFWICLGAVDVEGFVVVVVEFGVLDESEGVPSFLKGLDFEFFCTKLVRVRWGGSYWSSGYSETHFQRVPFLEELMISKLRCHGWWILWWRVL
jgi:hypothetical protein